MIEPATWGVPVISGPHLFNFSEASQLLLEGNAMVLCQDADSLAKQVLKLLQDDKLRNTMGESGRRIAQQNRGALDILLTQIKKQLAQ
jgi:3-deoxy-D-manno-octulosonic-acid transferase